MPSTTIEKLEELQGRMVGVSLVGGERLDACQLIALPLRRTTKFWLWTGREDLFVTPDDVIDVWES